MWPLRTLAGPFRFLRRPERPVEDREQAGPFRGIDDTLGCLAVLHPADR